MFTSMALKPRAEVQNSLVFGSNQDKHVDRDPMLHMHRIPTLIYTQPNNESLSRMFGSSNSHVLRIQFRMDNYKNSNRNTLKRKTA